MGGLPDNLVVTDMLGSLAGGLASLRPWPGTQVSNESFTHKSIALSPKPSLNPQPYVFGAPDSGLVWCLGRV